MNRSRHNGSIQDTRTLNELTPNDDNNKSTIRDCMVCVGLGWFITQACCPSYSGTSKTDQLKIGRNINNRKNEVQESRSHFAILYDNTFLPND